MVATAKLAPMAERRWDDLAADEQLAVVREVCGTKAASVLKRYDGVLAVGAGLKKSANAVTDSICLGVLVDKKKQIKRVSRPVPERLLVTVVRQGKPVRLSIPTDVEELGKGKPHAPINLAQGVRAFNRNNSRQNVPGAACCVVVDTAEAANRFLLGCRHVLALSLLTQGCAAFNATDVADRGLTTRVGQLFFPLPMAPDGQPHLDGAISLIDPRIPVDWRGPQGNKPTVVDPGVKQPRNCFVFTPNGPLQAQFVKEWANIPLQYARCGRVVIAGAYQFQAATVPGHSGSPVMTEDGTLFGMHFWGDPGQQLALAIPAFMLFQPGRFPVNIELS